MTKDEALDLALEALEKSLPRLAPYGEQDWLDSRAAITAIKQARAAPVHKPYRPLQDNGSQYFGGSWDTLPTQSAPVQEPAAWIWTYANGEQEVVFVRPRHVDASHVDAPSTITSLYTTPPAAQRQWVGLTPEEIYDCDEANACRSALAYAIEAKLKEKNT